MPVENMDSNLDVMRLNPAHITEFPNGFVLDNRYIKTIYDTKPPANTYFVAKNFETDEDGFKFSTIQAAIDQAIADDPNISHATNQKKIIVYPGTYEEQIHSLYGIHIVGANEITNKFAKSVRLINDGTSDSNYPLRSEIGDRYKISGINIETTDGLGVICKLPKTGIFSNCQFNGQWIENDIDTNIYLSCYNCDFRDANEFTFNFTGTDLPGTRYIGINSCAFVWQKLILESTHVNNADINIHSGSILARATFTVNGDWSFLATNSNIAGLDGRRAKIGTTGDINFLNCLMNAGLHFTVNPNSVAINKCSFNDGHSIIPSDEADITADVAITDVSYSENFQFHGIAGEIQIQCPIKAVGCNAPSRYFSIQDAIDSVPSGEIGTIDLRESLVDVAELNITPGASITVDGHKVYSLTFTGDIVEVPAGSKFGFADMVGVTGGNMEMNGAGAELSMESCQYISGYVTLTDGAFAIVYKSSLFGSTGHKAININTVDPIVVVGYSRIQGAASHEAVTFSVDADDKFKAKYSTFIHGDKDASKPLTFTGASGKVDIAMYNCGLNAAWDPAKLYNTIGSANNTTDTAITF